MIKKMFFENGEVEDLGPEPKKAFSFWAKLVPEKKNFNALKRSSHYLYESEKGKLKAFLPPPVGKK